MSEGGDGGGFGRRVLFGAAAALAIGTGTAVVGSKLTKKVGPGVGAEPSGTSAISITGMASSSGWMLQLHLPPGAHDIAVRLPDDEVFERIEQPYLTVSFERLRTRTPVEIRFTEANGVARGPVVVHFDPRAQAVASVRSILAIVAEWVAFRGSLDGDKDATLLYFTTLLVYKYAIAEIRWSVDSGDLDRRVRFTPSDRPGIANDDEIFVRLSDTPKYVALQIVFVDETTSAVKRFAPPKDRSVTGATMLGNRAVD